VPTLDESGQKRTEHDGRDARCEKVKVDGKECAERLRETGAWDGVECI
jgi:hypothetical protein